MIRGNPLIAFALVAEEYEKSGDPIRGLKPLFAPILSDRIGSKFNPEEFARRFKVSYGLQMSPFVANALSERLVEIGLLEIGPNHRDARDYVVSRFDWTPDRIDEGHIEQTLKLFTRWAGQRLVAAGRQIADPALEEAFLQRLARPEFASIFADEDAEKKNSRLKEMLGIAAVDPAAANDAYLDFLVADFVLAAAHGAPEVFNAVSRIAYGALVADAVAGLAVPGRLDLPDPPLRVVLDGPLVLDLLNLNTVEHQVYAEGLLSMIKEAGLMVAIFDHSIEEARSSIRSTIAAHQREDAYGPLAQRFRTERGHTLYASAVADSLEVRVRNLGITVLRSELYEEARYKKHFPEEREDQVRNYIGDLHLHVDARMRDAKSVATVARLKGDRRAPDSIFYAGTVFVTRNSVLAKRANRALSIGRTEPDPRFTIVTDGQFAGVMWFVSGITGVELSRKRLVANCSSAVLPKPDVIRKIQRLLEGLSQKLSDEFAALMTDQRASLCPMRLTSGIADSIDEAKSLAIVEAMKRQLIAPVIDRAESAEAEAAEARSALEREAARGKEMAVLLQGVIATQEGGFNQQLAQLALDLESEQRKVGDLERANAARKLVAQSKLQSAEEGFRRKEKRTKRALIGVLWILAVIASLVSILVPNIESLSYRMLLAAVYLASVPWLRKRFLAASAWIVGRMFAADKRYIAGLRDGAEP